MLINHITNEFRLQFYMRKRYWFETIISLILLACILVLVIFSISSLGDLSVEKGDFDSFIVGTILWFFAVSCFQSASGDISEETHHRTLEQFYISPISVKKLLAIRALNTLIAGLLLLCIAMKSFDIVMSERINFSILPILGIAVLASFSLVGIGYLVAGLSLLFKKVDLFQAGAYAAIIGLVAAPVNSSPILALLPYTEGASLARKMVNHETVSMQEITLVAINSAIYLALGLVAFDFLEKTARRKGVLGHW